MIRAISKDEAFTLYDLAKKDDIHLLPDVTFNGYFDDTTGELVGVSGYTWKDTKQGPRFTFRNSWVRPDSRGRGIFQALHDYRLKRVWELGAISVRADCTPDSLPLHLASGGIITKQFKRMTRVMYYPA
jgi:GNAT superfamily N-acetyltransferase